MDSAPFDPLAPFEDQSPFEIEFDSQVRALLLRLTANEQLAVAAHQDTERVYAWPSWSMDTGLTDAQERFVEAWSPRRIVDALRWQRQLIHELQSWIRTHRDDAEVDEALTMLTMLPIR